MFNKLLCLTVILIKFRNWYQIRQMGRRRAGRTGAASQQDSLFLIRTEHLIIRTEHVIIHIQFRVPVIYIMHLLVKLATQLPGVFTWRNDKWDNDTSKSVQTFTHNDRWQTARISNSCSTKLQMNKPIYYNIFVIVQVKTFRISVFLIFWDLQNI
jgi:hypothetical protein